MFTSSIFKMYGTKILKYITWLSCLKDMVCYMNSSDIKLEKIKLFFFLKEGNALGNGKENADRIFTG